MWRRYEPKAMLSGILWMNRAMLTVAPIPWEPPVEIEPTKIKQVISAPFFLDMTYGKD